jgi:hypothetical protein
MATELSGFEVFEKPARRRGRVLEPTVSITRTGQITVNSLAIDLFKDAPDSVLLLYNKKTDQVAIRASSIDDAKAFKVRYIKSGQGIISAKPFLEAYDIPFVEIRSFNPEQVDDATILVNLK